MQVTAGLEFIRARQAIELVQREQLSKRKSEPPEDDQQQQALKPPHKVQIYFGDVPVQQTVRRQDLLEAFTMNPFYVVRPARGQLPLASVYLTYSLTSFLLYSLRTVLLASF